ncbi:MAG: transcriptional repressor [Bdellovibrionaceae bacterium]|nr:transcriptional repressor [Pseudobdellovibrionaceae bacterium]
MKTPQPDLIRGQQNPQEELIKREPLGPAEYKNIIRDMGLKVTQQRMAILASLAKGRQHVTAQEVYEGIHEEHPEIGFATVYRFLRRLSESGYVTELRMGGMPARYELTPKHHHDHLTCISCGKIVEFENQDIERLQESVSRENGFKLTHHVLELYGYCSDCQ